MRELLSLESSREALLSARATGRFFQHGSACAYGETPLTLAFCTNQPEIARLLLENGADLEATYLSSTRCQKCTRS